MNQRIYRDSTGRSEWRLVGVPPVSVKVVESPNIRKTTTISRTTEFKYMELECGHWVHSGLPRKNGLYACHECERA